MNLSEIGIDGHIVVMLQFFLTILMYIPLSHNIIIVFQSVIFIMGFKIANNVIQCRSNVFDLSLCYNFKIMQDHILYYQFAIGINK